MNIQDQFCHTLVETLYAAGLKNVVVSPGSRSTPLVLAFYRHPQIKMSMRLDERSAGFFALGIASVTKSPVAVITSSGTAAIELHPAIVEASMSHIPIIAITADRPYELHDMGAPQTISQSGIYGDSLRYEINWPPPTEADSFAWRNMAYRLLKSATEPNRMGPVHLNVQFREPLIDEESTFHDYSDLNLENYKSAVTVETGDESSSMSTKESIRFVTQALNVSTTGDLSSALILALGPPGNSEASELLKLAEDMNWPIGAESRSGLKIRHRLVIENMNLIAENQVLPDELSLVIVSGYSITSKALMNWLKFLKENGVKLLILDRVNGYYDHLDVGDCFVSGNVGLFLRSLRNEKTLSFKSNVVIDKLKALDDSCIATIGSIFCGDELSAPGTSYIVGRCLQYFNAAVISSSMPIRDFETYGGAIPPEIPVIANRGANGIDGVVSTALGVSTGLSRNIKDKAGKVICLIGDLAFLYDLSALVTISSRQLVSLGTTGISVTFVVIDNNGGAIFSYLKQNSVMNTDEFETLFTTPHDLDISKVCESLNIPVFSPADARELKETIELSSSMPGINVIVVRTSIEADKQISLEIRKKILQVL